MSSSILRVAMGSRAEQGSSMSRISGSTASSRAMHRRCCCSSVRARAEVLRRSLTSSHISTAVEGALQDLLQFGFPGLPVEPGAVDHVVVDGQGKGVGALEDHAHLFAQLGEDHVGAEDVLRRR